MTASYCKIRYSRTIINTRPNHSIQNTIRILIRTPALSEVKSKFNSNYLTLVLIVPCRNGIQISDYN